MITLEKKVWAKLGAFHTRAELEYDLIWRTAMPLPWSYSSYAGGGGEGVIWGWTVSKKAVKGGWRKVSWRNPATPTGLGDGPKPVLDRALGFPCLGCDLKAGFHGPESSSWSLHLATQADSRVCFLLLGKSGTRGSRAVLPRDINSKRRQESLSHIFRSGYVYVCLCIPTIFSETEKGKSGLKKLTG